MPVVHTSRILIEKHEGPHRTASVEGFGEPLHFGIHGGIANFYKDKYGREFAGPEYPATLDHIIAGVAGWLTGTFGAALEARGIKSAGNLTANVEGDIEDMEGVLKISRIRLQYRIIASKDAGARVGRAVEVHADACPAYQSVKGCIDCSWEVQILEP